MQRRACKQGWPGIWCAQAASNAKLHCPKVVSAMAAQLPGEDLLSVPSARPLQPLVKRCALHAHLLCSSPQLLKNWHPASLPNMLQGLPPAVGEG